MATVRDVMSTELVTIEPGDSVAHAATMMGRSLTGSALVLSSDGELAGIFTERDIVRAIGSDFAAGGDPVEQWMTPDPVTVSADTDASAALESMLSRGFRHLPVMEGDSLVGIVSIRDVSRAVTDQERPGP
jgi:CBS domain-containing protein